MEHVHVARAEAFSFWTHAVAAVAAMAVLVALVIQAQGTVAVSTAAVYGGSLVLLFASSSFHHVVGQFGPRWYAVSRRLDHIAIFLLIAGTYTPVTILGLPPVWGWSIFGVIWSLAAAGIVLKVLRPHTARWFTTALYLIMGWVVIVAIWPLVDAFPAPGLALLAAGGGAYSGGAVIYATKRPDPWPDHVGFHGIWHVLVIVGAAFHVAFVGLYVL